MWWLAVAAATQVTLVVGVHRDAGTLYDIAADGAAGQCVVLGTSRLTCPARGPVRFRWGAGAEWELTGDLELEPGQEGIAFVLAPEAARADARERLRSEIGPDDVRELFFATSGRPLPPPSRGMIDDLLALVDHPDWRVRREVARALVPYVRRSIGDPLSADAPSLVPPGVFARLGRDPNRRVRQRTAALLREIKREDPSRPEASGVLFALAQDPEPRVRRVALTAMTAGVAEGASDAVDAWRSALGRVPEPGGVGRAACNGLARLRDHLEPGAVDPAGALDLVLEHHPERAWRFWSAWRDELPFDAARASFLLRETVGLSQPLLKAWEHASPGELADAVRAWEPGPPHSVRFDVVGGWLAATTDPALRAALGLPDSLSNASGTPAGQ